MMLSDNGVDYEGWKGEADVALQWGCWSCEVQGRQIATIQANLRHMRAELSIGGCRLSTW